LRPGQLPNIVSRWLREKEFIFEMTVHLRLTPSGQALHFTLCRGSRVKCKA